jgi:hypothetical protein
MNKVLNFGKFKGQKLSETPTWYQTWLCKQDWFKMDNIEVNAKKSYKYDVIRFFTDDYRMAFGQKFEIMFFNLSWDEAEAQKNLLNLYQLDDTTKFFGTDYSK